MKVVKKITCNSLGFIWISTAFYTFILNIVFYKKAYLSLGMEDVADYVLLASFVVFIFCFINVLFSVLFIGILRKPIVVVLLLISATASYFSFFYNIYIDSEMIANLFETNLGEAEALITTRLIVWIVVFGVIPSLFVILVMSDY